MTTVTKPKLDIKKYLVGAGFSIAVILSATHITAPSEGLVLRPYLDVTGVRTTCYGLTDNNNIKTKIQDKEYTEEECTLLLAKELQEVESKILPMIKAPINDYQRAAFVDFAYNKGVGAFQSSTMLGYLNAGNTKAACEQLTRWVFAGNCKKGTKDCVETSKGVYKLKLQGLVKRSELEMKFCLGEIKLEGN